MIGLETTRVARCRCVLSGSRCREVVSPDEPFCSDCVDRHPDAAFWGQPVGVVALEER